VTRAQYGVVAASAGVVNEASDPTGLAVSGAVPWNHW
jgi:hypothetical protein